MTQAAITTRQALDALMAELTEQLARDPSFRFRRTHMFATAWSEMWPGGIWIAQRVGESERARRLRDSMNVEELTEFNGLAEYYGQVSDEEALAALEAEVARQPAGWRIRRDLTLSTAFNPAWNAGIWVSNAHCPGHTNRQYSRRELTCLQMRSSAWTLFPTDITLSL